MVDTEMLPEGGNAARLECPDGQPFGQGVERFSALALLAAPVEDDVSLAGDDVSQPASAGNPLLRVERP